MTSHRILIGIATGIAALTFGMSAAHAAPGDQVWDTPSADGKLHLPDGTCYQPGSNPPVHADCNTTRATTPYIAGEELPDDPQSTAPADEPAPMTTHDPIRQAPAKVVAVTVDTEIAKALTIAPLFFSFIW